MTNINDLTEQQLNTLAALGQGWVLDTENDDWIFHSAALIGRKFYNPCNNGGQAMELAKGIKEINGEGLQLVQFDEYFGIYLCKAGDLYYSDYITGESLEVCIVRAFVASEYGTEIDYDAIVGGEA